MKHTYRNTQSLDSRITELDLEPILVKLIDEVDGPGWPLAKALKVANEYRSWLNLAIEFPGERHVPTKDVDAIWHQHILDTAKYAQDCEQIFGRFLHHFPYLGLRGPDDVKALADAFARTQKRLGVISTGDSHPSLCGDSVPDGSASICDARDVTSAVCSGGGGQCYGSGCTGSRCGPGVSALEDARPTLGMLGITRKDVAKTERALASLAVEQGDRVSALADCNAEPGRIGRA